MYIPMRSRPMVLVKLFGFFFSVLRHIYVFLEANISILVKRSHKNSFPNFFLMHHYGFHLFQYGIIDTNSRRD